MNLPFVTAICPTYRHPKLLASSLQLWLDQNYPLSHRQLIVLDDGETFYNQQGDGWILWSASERYPTISAKYNELLGLMNSKTEIVLVWEDDDTYLPNYVNWHVQALAAADFSKPSKVYSDYNRNRTGQVQLEQAAGRFHSSLAFRWELIRKVGGWPDTKRADFDQQLISKLLANCRKFEDTCNHGSIQYVYGWNTGSAHCQSTMQSPSDETWYDRAKQAYKEVPFVGNLTPKYDQRTISILEELGATCVVS